MLEQNKAIVRRYLDEVFTKGNLALMDEIGSSNFVSHDPAAGGEIHGLESVRQFVEAMHMFFPDIVFTIEDMLAEGNLVAARWTMRSQHEGEGLGLPATNLPVTVCGASFLRLVDGKIEEEWISLDTLRLANDLGWLTPRSGVNVN